MPAYNFQTQFAPKIIDRTKWHTIRPVRKHPTKVGDILYLNTGMRTKNYKRISEEVCLAIDPVQIDPVERMIILDGISLIGPEKKAFIQHDGFDVVEEFYGFFTRYPADVLQNHLQVIYWILP